MKAARVAGAALGGLLATATAHAQTNDHVFRSWRWSCDATAPRAAGLAGAMAAVADDASAALFNPAGLARLTKTEVAAGLLSRREGTAPPGDALLPRTGIGYAAVAARVGSRWVLAASVSEAHARRARLDESLSLPDGVAEVGSLDTVVTDLGLAMAWRLTPRLHLGGRVGRSRLALDGLYSREPATGPTEVRVETSGQVTRTSAGVGIVFEPIARLRLAATASNGLAWRFTRRAVSPLLGTVLDAGTGYDMRQPAVVSAALALEPSLKLRLTAQVDHVRYGQVRSSLVIAQGAHARADYALDDAWEPRVGAELSLPRKAASFQLRGGVHWQAPGQLRYAGADALEKALFPGSRRQAVGAVGASIVTRASLRLDMGLQFGGERSELTAGLAARF